MNYIKRFIAGLAFPATLLPIAYTVAYCLELGSIRSEPLQFMPLYIPLVFGLWNILDYSFGSSCPIKDKNIHQWVNGALLGLIVALVGVFYLGLPEKLLGLTGTSQYLPILIIPFLYALIWRYIISPLNDALAT